MPSEVRKVLTFRDLARWIRAAPPGDSGRSLQKLDAAAVAQKGVRPREKERGQALLPNLEPIGVELRSAAGKAFNVKTIAQVKKSPGREGGLVPALQ